MKKILVTFILGCLFMGAQGESLTAEELRPLEAQVKTLEREFAGERAKEKKSWFGQYQERRKEERVRRVEKKRIFKEERERVKQEKERMREEKQAEQERRREGKEGLSRVDRLYEEAKQLIREKRFKEAKRNLEEVDRLDPNRHWVDALLMEVDLRIQRDARRQEEEREQRQAGLAKPEVESHGQSPRDDILSEATGSARGLSRRVKTEEQILLKPKKIVEKKEKSAKGGSASGGKEEKQGTSQAKELLEKGKGLIEAGDYSQANDLLDQALKIDPKLKEVKRYKAIAQRKKKEEARAVYQRVAAKRKSDKKQRREEKEQRQAEKERRAAERRIERERKQEEERIQKEKQKEAKEEERKQRQAEKERREAEREKRIQESREGKRLAAERRIERERKQEEERIQKEKQKEAKEEERKQRQAEKERREAEREKRIQESREGKRRAAAARRIEKEKRQKEEDKREARQSWSKGAVGPEKEQERKKTLEREQRKAEIKKEKEIVRKSKREKKIKEKEANSFLIQSGETALKMKQYDAAIAAYEAALRLEPESNRAQRGIRLVQAAKQAEARKIMRPITVYFHDATLAEMFEHLQEITGANFVVPDEVKRDQDRKTLFIQEMPLEDALQEILKDKEFVYSVKNRTVSITKFLTSH